MKRILLAIIVCIGVNMPSFADFREHFEAGQQSLLQNQYSTAIIEFKKALRINYLDNSTRVGLINSYLARAAYYGTTAEDWEAAANDFRAALFYMQYYPNETNASNSVAIISQANNNLETCLQMQKFDTSPANRFRKAVELRQAGKFAEAAYEYNKASVDEQFQEEAYIQLADLFKLMGNEEASLPYYQKALDINKQNGPVRLKYARTLDRLNKVDEAVSQYNYALMQSGEDQEILYALERIYLKKIQKTPNDAELYANVGAIKQKQKDYDTALRYYAKAEQINPTNVQTRLNIGTLYQEQQDYVKALQSYNSILVLYPDNVEANLYKAQALEASGDKRLAYDAYKKVVSLDANNAFAKSKLNELVMEGMSPNDIVAYLKNSVNKNPEMINTLYEHAVELHKDNKVNEAIKFYREVIKYDSTNEDAYVNLAICYGQKNDYERAKQILTIAQSKFPNNTQVKSTLANIESDSKSDKLATAIKSYENGDFSSALNAYMSIEPATKDSLLGVAACYQGLKQYDGAIDYYKKAQKLAPADADISYYIGAMYIEKGDLVNAEAFLKPIAQKHSQAKELLAFVSQKTSMEILESAIKDFEANSYDVALEKLNKLLDSGEKNAYANYYRAMVYDAKNERLKAVDDYKKVVELAPEIVIANYLMAIDYDILQKFVDAYKAYEVFLSKYTNDDEYRTYALKRLEDLEPYAEK